MILAYIPCRDEKEAKRIGKKLVEDRIIACANIIPAITSFYLWHSELHQDKEALLVCKTHEKKRDVLERAVKKLHSYDTPCIAVLKVDYINRKYEDWLKKQVKRF